MRHASIALLLALARGGCSAHDTVTSPSIDTQPWRIENPPPGPPRASLSARFSARVVPANGMFFYGIDLVLFETGGASNATVTDMRLIVPGGESGSDCGPVFLPVRIERGRSWNFNDWSYCAPYAWSGEEAASIDLELVYYDDEGRRGEFFATGPVTR